MDENLITALEISLIGMSLIFAGIVLLWGLMTLLVRVVVQDPANLPIEVITQGEDELKKQVAAVAVAVALAQQASSESPQVFPIQTSPSLSPWQIAWRSGQMRQKR